MFLTVCSLITAVVQLPLIERQQPAEAVWKRIFTELAIGTPLHSRSLNGVPIFGNVATLKVFCAQSVPLCS